MSPLTIGPPWVSTSLMKIIVEELHTEEVRIVLKALLVVVSVRGEKLNSGRTNIRWVLGRSVLQNECGEQINHLHPNISMPILHAVLSTFLMALRSFFSIFNFFLLRFHK